MCPSSCEALNVLLFLLQALPRFDIYNTSGGPNSAYVASLPAFVDSSQLLTVRLNAIIGKAKLNALLINNGSAAGGLRGVDALPPPSRTFAINAGGGAVGNSSGTGPYVADAYFVGGAAVNVSGVQGVGAVGEVFQTARTGGCWQCS
jgi:hypothetical protein